MFAIFSFSTGISLKTLIERLLWTYFVSTSGLICPVSAVSSSGSVDSNAFDSKIKYLEKVAVIKNYYLVLGGEMLVLIFWSL